jgi:hypothetical protein
MSVEGAGDHFVVSHGPNLVWTISKDLSGFIQSVKTPKFDYLRSDSVGLSVRLRSGALIPLAPAAWQVTGVIGKHGPIDCTLRFEGTGTAKENRGVSWKLELEFPRSKSWVHVRWQIEDPRDQVAGLVADLNLQVGDGPTLVDFGIDDLVYAALPEGQVVALEAPPRKLQDRPGAAWATYRGPPSKLEPYVIGGSGTPGTRRGWAHVMDRQRCTAVAIDGFGERSRDQIEIESTGRMKIDREAGGISGPKMLDFWIHFVPFPPHIGAVTSPQSMQSPLSVEVAR